MTARDDMATALMCVATELGMSRESGRSSPSSQLNCVSKAPRWPPCSENICYRSVVIDVGTTMVRMRDVMFLRVHQGSIVSDTNIY